MELIGHPPLEDYYTDDRARERAERQARRDALRPHREALYRLPVDQLFEVPGRPQVVFAIRDYSRPTPKEGRAAARAEVPYLFKAFETGQKPPPRPGTKKAEQPRAATIHEYLDWTVTASEPEDPDELGYGRALLECLEGMCRTLGIPRILLCSTDDARTKATWQRLGFTFTSRGEMAERWGVTPHDLLHMDNTVQARGGGGAGLRSGALFGFSRCLWLLRARARPCMDNTARGWMGFAPRPGAWGPPAASGRAAGGGAPAPAPPPRPPPPTPTPTPAPTPHPCPHRCKQMVKEVPPPPPWRPLMIRHGNFRQRVYYLPGWQLPEAGGGGGRSGATANGLGPRAAGVRKPSKPPKKQPAKKRRR
eukprot:scaffold17.g558.t1